MAERHRHRRISNRPPHSRGSGSSALSQEGWRQKPGSGKACRLLTDLEVRFVKNKPELITAEADPEGSPNCSVADVNTVAEADVRSVGRVVHQPSVDTMKRAAAIGCTPNPCSTEPQPCLSGVSLSSGSRWGRVSLLTAFWTSPNWPTVSKTEVASNETQLWETWWEKHGGNSLTENTLLPFLGMMLRSFSVINKGSLCLQSLSSVAQQLSGRFSAGEGWWSHKPR